MESSSYANWAIGTMYPPTSFIEASGWYSRTRVYRFYWRVNPNPRDDGRKSALHM